MLTNITFEVKINFIYYSYIMHKDKYIKYRTKYINLKINQNVGLNFKEELKEILTATVNAKIVGMGQATHGQDMINKYTANILKELIKNQNVTVFVLEDQYSCCCLINNFIRSNDNYSLDILIKI